MKLGWIALAQQLPQPLCKNGSRIPGLLAGSPHLETTSSLDLSAGFYVERLSVGDKYPAKKRVSNFSRNMNFLRFSPATVCVVGFSFFLYSTNPAACQYTGSRPSLGKNILGKLWNSDFTD